MLWCFSKTAHHPSVIQLIPKSNTNDDFGKNIFTEEVLGMNLCKMDPVFLSKPMPIGTYVCAELLNSSELAAEAGHSSGSVLF